MGSVFRIGFLSAVLFTVALPHCAAATDDFGFEEYIGDGFTISVPDQYLVETEPGENGCAVTRIRWSDAYMRDFRVIVTRHKSAGTLAELMYVYERAMFAENAVRPDDLIIDSTRLGGYNAGEGYRGEYTVEDTAGVYYKSYVRYLGKNGDKYILDVALTTGKMEGGLDVVNRILDSFRING